MSVVVPSWIAPVVTRLRTTHPYVVDAALAALVLFATTLQWIFPGEKSEHLTWQGFALGAATAVPLVWRRRAPFLTACAVSVVTPAMAIHHAPPPDVVYGGAVALYTVAALCPPVQRRILLVGWLLGVAATMNHFEVPKPYEYAFHLMTVVCAYALGMLARLQRAYTAQLEDRALRLERERTADTQRARAQERSRIARDMHDVLAHAVSLMVVQAEAGPVVVRRDPERAEAAFDAIAASGRDAMGQLRRILGVLAEERAAGVGAERLPQPGVVTLPELVRQVRESTGLRVEMRTSGEPRALPPDTDVAAFRVVQEALTNTVKHAYASSATVALDWTEDALTLTVTDDGRGPAGLSGGQGGQYVQGGQGGQGGVVRPGGQGGQVRPGGPGRQVRPGGEVRPGGPGVAGPAGRPGGEPGGGQGLIGIRERASACGGTAESGLGPRGGFRVLVRLPVAAAEREAAVG
ncbi:histidine kinase [Streptomyces sp. NPDC093252]|uniref:sensor histidine kinase n=1 Tax=Streptomyces sp. NPDC093252 TaxID=3154980 RepID=UPI00341466AA